MLLNPHARRSAGAPPLQNHVLLSEAGDANDSAATATTARAGPRPSRSEAGWKPGSGGIRSKVGRPLQLTMLLHQGDSVGQSIAHLVQAMYQQVGLKFTLQTINQNDYFQNYVEEGKFQIGLREWDDPPYPISGSRPVYQEPQGKNLIQNFGAVSSPQIDAPGASFAMWIRGQCSGLN